MAKVSKGWLRVDVAADSSATPAQVLALAGTDFSPARANVWPNVTERRLEVHERGDSHVDVTEGGTGPARWFWERCRYDWSEPGTVKATVINSNVIEPGSTFELRVTPNGDGCRAEMTLDRRFRRCSAGRIGYAFNRVMGRPGFGFMLRQALRAVERRSDRVGRA